MTQDDFYIYNWITADFSKYIFIIGLQRILVNIYL